jgi:hypothetical protein
VLGDRKAFLEEVTPVITPKGREEVSQVEKDSQKSGQGGTCQSLVLKGSAVDLDVCFVLWSAKNHDSRKGKAPEAGRNHLGKDSI